jgi:GWxTD domain-containing protein
MNCNICSNAIAAMFSTRASRVLGGLRLGVLCRIGIALLLGLALTATIATPARAQKLSEKRLSKSYREWLDHDVVYIIAKEERRAFLSLTSDEARDKFIERFWEIRNPTPGSPINTYKDEIYQRIAYANANFGTGSGTDGWRTSRGQTYITLGPPQQKQTHRVSANLVPLEVWFYSNSEYPFLPPFFSVMFYQRENFGDYRFYSPYMDGPDKLVNGTEAINDRVTALRLIQNSLGPEIERLSLSLLPGEPVDLTGATATMESDSMLAMIKALGEQPLYRKMIENRRTMMENVTSRLIVEGHNLDIITLPVRDSHGLTRLDYAIRLHNPSDLSVVQESNGQYKYSVEVRVRVFDSESRLLFTQQRSSSDSLDKDHFLRMKDKIFGYESMLPLPPGKYRLDFLLTDWIKKVGMHAEREVTIPPVDSNALQLPGAMAFSAAETIERGKADLIPFVMAGVKFTPLAGAPLVLSTEQPLQIVYQVWASPDALASSNKKLEVEYAFGQLSSGSSAKVIKDEIDLGEVDATGSLVNGKKLSLLGDPVGNYILTISLQAPKSLQRAFATLNFRLLSGIPVTPTADVVDPLLTIDSDNGVLDQQRGLCYFAQGLPDLARPWFRRALARNRLNDPSRTRLVDAYFSKQEYNAVVSLFNDTGVTDDTDSETLIRIAASLEKSGDPKKAATVLENAIRLRPDEGSLYLALAECYDLMGNSQKAAELTKKGRSYLGAAGPSPSVSP